MRRFYPRRCRHSRHCRFDLFTIRCQFKYLQFSEFNIIVVLTDILDWQISLLGLE